MPIVAAAVVPHSPVLLPTIAKQHAPLVAQTVTAITNLAADWYAAKPDVAIILTPHGATEKDSVVIHSAENYTGGFLEFGDMATTVKAMGAVGVMHQIKSAAEHEHFPLHLQTLDQLDYGTGVPLTFLLSAQPQLPICSIIVNTQKTDSLLRLGAVLREFCVSSKHRFLLISSSDMSRRAEKTPDSHRRPTAEEKAFSSAIVEVNPSQLTAITPQASTCGYGPLLTLVGSLQNIAHHGTIEYFEAPLGVGLLTASFSFNS